MWQLLNLSVSQYCQNYANLVNCLIDCFTNIAKCTLMKLDLDHNWAVVVKMNRLMTTSKWLCAQRRLRSAWASPQSDQSLRCAYNGSLGIQAFFMRTAKTLIRLGGCPGWSEFSLGAHAILLVFSRGSSNVSPSRRDTLRSYRACAPFFFQRHSVRCYIIFYPMLLMRRLIWAFEIYICPKTHICMAQFALQN